jgi:hypothetical protein
MKEIDFLPSWYRNSRRRSIGYKWQYGIITVAFVLMAGWSFIAGRIVNSTTASVANVNIEQTLSNEIEKVNTEIAELQAKAQLLEKCSTNVKLSSIIAELSHLIESDIVLKSLQINSENASVVLADNTGPRTVINRNSGNNSGTLEDDEVYKIVIIGVAKTSEEVANLLFNLEKSSYFTTVIMEFSQNVKVKDFYVTEFKLSCYLANYKIKADK